MASALAASAALDVPDQDDQAGDVAAVTLAGPAAKPTRVPTSPPAAGHCAPGAYIWPWPPTLLRRATSSCKSICARPTRALRPADQTTKNDAMELLWNGDQKEAASKRDRRDSALSPRRQARDAVRSCVYSLCGFRTAVGRSVHTKKEKRKKRKKKRKKKKGGWAPTTEPTCSSEYY